MQRETHYNNFIRDCIEGMTTGESCYTETWISVCKRNYRLTLFTLQQLYFCFLYYFPFLRTFFDQLSRNILILKISSLGLHANKFTYDSQHQKNKEVF